MSSIAPPPASAVESQETEKSEKPDGKDPSLANLLSAIYRLLKLARMYDGRNQVLTDGAEAVVGTLADFCKSQRAALADIIFANDTIFVNGVMVPMSRDVYDRAMELAQLLFRAGITNLELSKHTKADDLTGFVQALARVLRDSNLKDELRKATFGGVTTRWVRWRASLETEAENVSRVVRTYSTAVVLVRRFYAAYASGKVEMPIVLPRVAARIVSHAEGEPPLLVALVAKRAANMDEATIAVNSAIVAALMARQITTDRMMVANLVLAALLYDAGRRRLLGAQGGGAVMGQVQRPLSEGEQGRLAPSNAAVTVALDRDSDAAFAHAFIAYEAHELRRASKLSSVYGTPRPPSILARILHVARSFSELMVPGPYAAAMGPYDAAEFLASRASDDNDRLFVKLLLGGLGVFPPGTTVELSTGEVGVVARVPDLPVDFARPPVRLIFDRSGTALREPVDLDLAAADGGELRTIVRTIDADSQQQKFMRSFVLAITREEEQRARKPPPAPPPPPAPAPRPHPADVIVTAPPPPVVRAHPADAIVTAPPPPVVRQHPADAIVTAPPPPVVRQHPADAIVTAPPPAVVRAHPADAIVTPPPPPRAHAGQARANVAPERAERASEAAPAQAQERPSQVVPAGRAKPEVEAAPASRRHPGRGAVEERGRRRIDPRVDEDEEESSPADDPASDSHSGARPRPTAASPATAVHPVLPVQPAITYNREELPSDKSLPGVVWPSAAASASSAAAAPSAVAAPASGAARPVERRGPVESPREDKEASQFPPERPTSSRNRVLGADRPPPIPRVDPRAEDEDDSIPGILKPKAPARSSAYDGPEPKTGSRFRSLEARPVLAREEPHSAAPPPTKRIEPAPASPRAAEPTQAARVTEPRAAARPARPAEPLSARPPEPAATRAERAPEPEPPPSSRSMPEPAAPAQPARPRAKPKSETAATVQRSWSHFAAELAASRGSAPDDDFGTEAEIPEESAPRPAAPEEPVEPRRPVRRSNAPTVARSWADHAADLRASAGQPEAEEASPSAVLAADAEEPTRRAEWGQPPAIPRAAPTGARSAHVADEHAAYKEREKRAGGGFKITVPEEPAESPLALADGSGDDAPTREREWKSGPTPKRRP